MEKLYLERLLSGVRLLTRRPRYVAPHHVTGLRSRDGATEWDEPETIGGHGMHYPKRGKVDHIREVPEEYAVEFCKIAEERARLQKRLADLLKQERELMMVVYPHSRPVVVAELKELQELEKAMK